MRILSIVALCFLTGALLMAQGKPLARVKPASSQLDV
jgi:hypothetical protein